MTPTHQDGGEMKAKVPDLKPCPFCGGEEFVMVDTVKGLYGFNVRCEASQCHANGPEGHTPEMACELWNKQALKANGMREALEDIARGPLQGPEPFALYAQQVAKAALLARPIPQDHADSATDAPAGWLTIATAPRDTHVLVCWGDVIIGAILQDHDEDGVNGPEVWTYWTSDDDLLIEDGPDRPTRWMPMPPLAALKTQDHGEKALREALEEIAKRSTDLEDPEYTSEDSMGNYDDVFTDGGNQEAFYCARIARAALAALPSTDRQKEKQR